MGPGRSSWRHSSRTGVLGCVWCVAVRAADRKGRGPRRALELELVQTLGRDSGVNACRALSNLADLTAAARRRTPVRTIDDAAGCPADSAAGDRLFLLAFYYITKVTRKVLRNSASYVISALR